MLSLQNFSLRAALASFAMTLAAAPVLAQAVTATPEGPAPSRLEVYAGYGYFHPHSSDIGNRSYEILPFGAVGSISGYFTKNFGLELEGNAFPDSSDDYDCVYTAQAGPIARAQFGRFVPFVHALGGAAKIGGPASQQCNVWGWGVTGGVGVDYIVPAFHNHLSIRPVQGDFMYSQIDNGKLLLPDRVLGGFGEIYAWRLSAGLSYRFGAIGGTKGGTTSLTCSADPGTVYPGDPISLTASANNFHDNKLTKYVWTTSGGKVTGTEATESLDTSGLTPGTYTVGATLEQGKHDRPVANCTSSFTLKDFDPPTLTCTADRAAINSGDPVVITAAGMSPQNRPLTYTYTATNGQITGNGATAALSTNGATPGTITVTCLVTDDKGKSATARASVVIATPPAPAPVAQAKALCSLAFDRDRKRPDRVDNEAKACLDDISLTLNRDATTRLVLIGNHGEGETNRDSAARAMNASDYLTKEKGIDAGRIDLRIAADPTRSVATMLLPAGVGADASEGSAFDTTTVVRKGQAYGMPGMKTAPRKHRKRRKAATVAAAPTI